MADDPKQSTPNIGANGFTWILLVAAGTYFVAHQLPLEGSRPPTTEAVIGQPVGVQDVDARLWQDPFAAVAEALRRSPEFKPKNCLQDKLKDRIKNHCFSPLNESRESNPCPRRLCWSWSRRFRGHPIRRNTNRGDARVMRFSAGLNVEGFIPEDLQHVGFYWPSAAASSEVTQDGQAPKAGPEISLPKVVPFEWFRRTRESVPYQAVLLLWFDEDALQDIPIKQFGAFLCRSLAASGASVPWAKATIFGPSLSTTLQSMAKESSTGGFCPDAARPDFYVNSATADDQTLIPDYVSGHTSCIDSDTCLHDYFLKKGVNLYRMIATDEALARAFKAELRLRRVDDKASHIALVSEWDTLYGRALPNSIARCFGEQGEACRQTDADPFVNKPWLHRFKYLRGLDGQVPGSEVPGSEVAGSEAPGGASGSKDSGKRRTAARTPQRSGRMPSRKTARKGRANSITSGGWAISMQDVDRRLHRETGNEGIEAVGILGSDLYDKLLVLQALKPVLPDALFFTTDLDALIMHPIALTSTRNLLSHRASACASGLPFREKFRRSAAAIKPPSSVATRIALRHNNDPLPFQFKPRPWLPPCSRSALPDVFQFAEPGL